MGDAIFIHAAQAILDSDIGEDAVYQRLAGGDPITLRVSKGTVLDFVPEFTDMQTYIGMVMFEMLLDDLSPYEPLRGDTITVISGVYTIQSQLINDGITVQVVVVQ